MDETKPIEIAIMGAGMIGCYIGGALASAGANVRLIGRPSFLDEIGESGLRVTDFDGLDRTVPAERLMLSVSADAAAGADFVLVTVKSDGTESAGRDLEPHLAPGTPVLSLQNGVDNADALSAALPAQRVFAGMVPFNVVKRGAGHFHQATGGAIRIDDDPALQPLADLFAAAGLPLERAPDMRAVLWGKLLVNLNNAINALSDKPLAEQLSSRDYRRCWAMCLNEGLRVLKAAGVRPESVLAFPIERMPTLLSLPNFLYRRIMARRKTTVDRHAKGSMADDLSRGRRTEVGHLNGAIVSLAERLGRKAPVNARVVALVHAAESGAEPWPADKLLAELKAAA